MPFIVTNTTLQCKSTCISTVFLWIEVSPFIWIKFNLITNNPRMICAQKNPTICFYCWFPNLLNNESSQCILTIQLWINVSSFIWMNLDLVNLGMICATKKTYLFFPCGFHLFLLKFLNSCVTAFIINTEGGEKR